MNNKQPKKEYMIKKNNLSKMESYFKKIDKEIKKDNNGKH